MTIHQSDRQTKVIGRAANQSVVVPFHGDNLYLVEHDGDPYVPMKPVVEGMGLNWDTQRNKIHRKFKGAVEMTLPSAGGNQSMICLPLRKLPAWLYSVQPGKVAPEIREKVVAYQEECDEVLWQYWTTGKADRQSVRKAAKSYLPEYRQARAIKMTADAITVALSVMPNLSQEARQTAMATAVNTVVGDNILPLPVLTERYYTAGEVGERFGISANKVGRIANEHNLKTERYGKFFLDKSRSSTKQVETFRYNEAGVEAVGVIITALEVGGAA
ncbi:TPA: phage antirepressor N-terminal domain-containing protein [Aeromonas veronii]|uniref:phage antirepressor N-terminal domain-containing protein n=1 Tax=Aeromonas caviae TaxID=648 RepID=UPI00227FF98F|nr:phage antirepressor N-terminal domain-containing protein [Aeromonas caviae]MCY9814489.1 phage antirepressor N-terminal domain-containing protein [Aeromonas caviae]